MPTVFFSYSRADEGLATRLAQEFELRGITVWRDQRNLRAGESWPKALGDAIAACDALVLLWSREAAESEWVESEWSTASANRKPVFPCLADSTPLPPLLRGIQAVGAKDVANAAESIADALGVVTNPVEKPKDRRRKIWIAGLILVLLMLAGIALRSRRPAEQVLAGTIGDENGHPLPGVQVSVLLDGKIVSTGETDEIGHYRLKVGAPADAEVSLVAKKAGYFLNGRYARLGNTDFGFNMRRESR